jgi:carboxylesterase type B
MEAQLLRYKVSRAVEVTRSWNMEVHHGNDIFFTFMSDKLTEEERETPERLCSDWLKFAYEEKLDETSDWNRYDLNKPTMLVYGEQIARGRRGYRSCFVNMPVLGRDRDCFHSKSQRCAVGDK